MWFIIWYGEYCIYVSFNKSVFFAAIFHSDYISHMIDFQMKLAQFEHFNKYILHLSSCVTVYNENTITKGSVDIWETKCNVTLYVLSNMILALNGLKSMTILIHKWQTDTLE